MKNKIRKIIKREDKKYILSLTYDIAQLIALSAFIVCFPLLFIFDITYMNSNRVFSYNFLSFEILWVIIVVFLESLIFGLLYLPINLISWGYRNNDRSIMIFFSVLLFYIVMLIVLTAINFGLNNPHWTIFGLFMGAICCIIVETLLRYYGSRNFRQFFSILILVLIVMLYVAIMFPNVFNAGFKKFLEYKSLAADKVEIYLKDRNQFVIGKMVFRDSKFAYVIYDDTNLSNSSTDSKGHYYANKLVPVENITILKSHNDEQ